MGFRHLWSCSTVLLILLEYSYSVTSTLVASECVHNRDDYVASGWEHDSNILHWAKSGDDLPQDLVGKLVGQEEDVFYFDLAHTNTGNHFIMNDFSWAEDAWYAYVYIRYYAHSKNAEVTTKENEFYVSPTPTGGKYHLQAATDFTWKEAFVEVDPSRSEKIHIGAHAKFPLDSYLFIDTVVLLRANEPLEIADALATCPGKTPYPPPSTITPMPSTSGSTKIEISSEAPAMATTLPNEYNTPFTSTFPPTTNPISTTRPSDPALECINYQNDFSSHNWQSNPFHQYAEDSASLPVELRGKLNASGVFYLEGSSGSENQVYFKDYQEANDPASVPTYLYLKYYAFTSTNNSQVFYVRPAHVHPGDLTMSLPLGRGYSWEETIVQLEERIEGGRIEFGMQDFQAGEYLLVDKIAVVRSEGYVEALDLVESCAEE